MPFTRILQHAVVLGYLLLLSLGVLYSIFRFDAVPLRPLTHFIYGMLAPYQGAASVNEAFFVEGQTPFGDWNEIDLAPYFPVLNGERNMRESALYRNKSGFESLDALYKHLAEMLLKKEMEAGRVYERVRLSWVQWEPSAISYRENFYSPLKSRVLVIVP